MPSLLFVDPDPKFSTSLAELFAGRGFRTATAQSGEEAQALLRNERFELILTEIQLPGMSGFDLVRESRVIDPYQAFAVLTGSESFWWAHESIRLGAREYLVKHLDRVDFLVESIERVSRRLRAERESRELLAHVGSVHDELLKSLVHLEREKVSLEERLGQATPRTLDPYRILVVDDEPLVGAVLRELFVDAGFHVDTTTTGEDAMMRLDAGGTHLVLADKNLPGLSGLDLLRYVKDVHPGVEVVMMTGYASLESAIEALDMGASAYLLKPFDDLQEVIRKVRDLRRKQESRARAADFLDRFKSRNRAFIDKYEELRRRLSELSALGGA